MTANRTVRKDRETDAGKFSSGHKTRQAALHQLVAELAATLLPLGVTPLELSDAAKQEFCARAAKLSRFENGRVNKSRVAVLTGLRRGEVRKILSTIERGELPPRTASPIESVVQGWHSNKLFASKRGEPKRLTLSGKRDSFERLVRLYANDIPPQAVLTELTRLGLVVRKSRRIELQGMPVLQKLQSISSLARLMPAIVDVLRVSSLKPTLHKDLPMKRLVLHADNLVDLAMLRERCMSSIESMLIGLEGSLSYKRSRNSKQKMRASHSCAVTVLLVENTNSRQTGFKS